MNNRIIFPQGGVVFPCAGLESEFYTCRSFREEKRIIGKVLKARKPEGYFTTPLPVEFATGGDGDSILISESADMSNALEFSADGGSAEVYNLKRGKIYYYTVNGSPPVAFSTAGSLPRWIYAPGYVNIRDCGGETTRSGKKIKQGLYYRGPRLEKSGTPEGIAALRALGIKTDLDLRKEVKDSLKESPLGADIRLIIHPCEGYDEFIAPGVRENTKQLIEYFADESIYPVYFHCHGGQDRTGTLAFMLGAILGLDDEKLIREYEQTALTFPDKKMSRSRKDKLKPLLKELKKHNKRKTLGENAVDILRECGVSEETMQKIRDLLLES